MPSHEHPGNGEDLSVPAGSDFGTLTDSALCEEIERLAAREHEISFQRRFLHGQLQLARTELSRRLTLDSPLDVSRDALEGIDRLLDGIDLQEGM